MQFNVVCKGLGSERMSFYLNEAAGDIRGLMLPTLEGPEAKRRALMPELFYKQQHIDERRCTALTRSEINNILRF